MLRSALTLILALTFVAEAAAQTMPATKTATRRTTPKKAVMRNTTARPAPTETGGRNNSPGAVGSAESADDKGQSLYAAPGMPVNVSDPKKVGSYDGPAATKTKSNTTLTPR